MLCAFESVSGGGVTKRSRNSMLSTSPGARDPANQVAADFVERVVAGPQSGPARQVVEQRVRPVSDAARRSGDGLDSRIRKFCSRAPHVEVMRHQDDTLDAVSAQDLGAAKRILVRVARPVLDPARLHSKIVFE